MVARPDDRQSDYSPKNPRSSGNHGGRNLSNSKRLSLWVLGQGILKGSNCRVGDIPRKSEVLKPVLAHLCIKGAPRHAKKLRSTGHAATLQFKRLGDVALLHFLEG